MLDYPVWSILLALFSCNTYGSYLVFADEKLSASQKRMQLLMVWMLPLIGAAILVFVKECVYDEWDSKNRADK